MKVNIFCFIGFLMTTITSSSKEMNLGFQSACNIKERIIFKPYVDVFKQTDTIKVDSLTNKVCVYGIDSLTDGAGGSSYREYFDPVWKSVFSSSELGYVWFNLRDAKNQGLSYKVSTNMIPMISAKDYSVAPIKYSLCGKGVFTKDGDGSDYITLDTKGAEFARFRIYYLQQPGGGTFSLGFSNTESRHLTNVNSEGVLELKFIEVEKNASDTSIISIKRITGELAFFCVRFMKDEKNSASVCNIAKGGMKMEQINELDRTFRQQWYSEINPELLLLNAGANDQKSVNGITLKTWLGNYINDVKLGSPNCKIVLVQPNQTSSWRTDFSAEHLIIRKELSLEKGVEFFNTIEIVGDYKFFVENEMMGDGTHPNKKGFRIIAENYLHFLGITN